MRTLDLMRNIDRTKYKFHFCTLSDKKGELDEEIIKLGGIIHRCPLNWGFPVNFRRLLQRNKFDIIHSHVFMFSGYINKIAKSFKIKTRIAHLRSMGDGKPRTLKNQLSKAIFRYLLNKYSTDIISVSENTMAIAWNQEWNRDTRCRIVYNGIDLSNLQEQLNNNFVVEDIREELGIPLKNKILVHIGRFNQAKNHEKLIRVFYEILTKDSEVSLILIGKEDGEFNKIKALAKELNIAEKIIFTGIRTDIYRYLLASDLMIFPSIREGLPGVVLEASATGLPIVASDIKVIEELKAYLGNLKTLPLDLSDKDWAAKVLQELHTERIRNFQDSLSDFKKSKFYIKNTVNEITTIYDRR